MKLFERFYNWLSDTDPYIKYREHRSRKLFLNAPPEFLKWAFSDHYEDLRTIEKCRYWNITHGEHLHIQCENRFYESVPEMIRIWEEQKDCE